MASTHAPAVPQSPATQYLERAGAHLDQMRAELDQLTAVGEQMAAPLLRGGGLFVPPVAPYWPSEFCGRAGGLMGVRGRRRRRVQGLESEVDVAFFALPDPARWQAQEDETLKKLVAGPGHLFVNGRPEEVAALDADDRFAGFTGGDDHRDAGYRFGAFDPLVRFREFEQLVRGWSATGELIGSCIRHGRMPTIYMSVWLEGAMVRNASFVDHDNLQEPWAPPMFHDRLYIPPPAPGAIAAAFLDEVERVRQVLLAQQDRLAQAASWLAEAREAGKRTWAVAVGHSYPEILDWPEDAPPAELPLAWGRTNSNLARAIPAEFADGDTVLHLGYAPVNSEHVRHWLDRGVRLIHTSPYGPPLDLEPYDNWLWLDLPWRPGDATVDLPGYSVRLLPLSSSVQTLAYFAILSEMAERLGWR